MGFLKLNRYGDPTNTGFDPEKIIEKIRESFAEATIFPGDQLALSATKASSSGAAHHVVETLRRNQDAYGPAYAFEIPLDDDILIQGRARRFDVTFIYPEELPPEWHSRLLAFLQALGPGKLECTDDRVGAPG